MHRSKSQIALFSGYHPAHTRKASEGSSTFLDVSLSPPTQPSRVRLFKCQGKVWLVAWKMMRKCNRWIWRCRRCCKAKICARICIKSRASQWMSRRLSSASSKARRSSLKTSECANEGVVVLTIQKEVRSCLEEEQGWMRVGFVLCVAWKTGSFPPTSP